jgi:large subunit ribosomal protein L19
MTVQVFERIRDVSPKGEPRERVQIFEGIILSIRGAGVSRTMTVRKISHGVGVEKIYPLSSPNIVKVAVLQTARVRRANLGFLRRGFKRALKEK